MSDNNTGGSTWGTGDADAETRMAGASDEVQDAATQRHESDATQIAYPSAPQATSQPGGQPNLQAYPSAPPVEGQPGQFGNQPGQFSAAGYGEAPTQAAFATNQGQGSSPAGAQAPYSQGYPGQQAGQQLGQQGYPSAPPTQSAYPSAPQAGVQPGVQPNAQQSYPSAPPVGGQAPYQSSYPSAPGVGQQPQAFGQMPNQGGYSSANPAGYPSANPSGYPSAPAGGYQSNQPVGGTPAFGAPSASPVASGMPGTSAPSVASTKPASAVSPLAKFGPFLPALLSLIAPFLAWVTFKNGSDEVKLNGIGGNSNMASAALGASKNMAGIFGIILALGLVAVAVMAILNKLSAKVAGIITAAIGAVLTLLALFQFVSVSQAVNGAAKGYEGTIGMGVWLTLLAGLLALVLGVLALMSAKKSTTSDAGTNSTNAWGAPAGQSGFGQQPGFGQQGGQVGQGGQFNQPGQSGQPGGFGQG